MTYRAMRRIICLVVLLIFTSCTPSGSPSTIVAATDAQALGTTREGAKETKDGVTVTVRFGVWDARPRVLAQKLLPVFIRVSNGSSSSYKVRPNSFTLYYLGIGPVLPTPPEEISGRVEELVETHPFISPYWGGWGWSRGWGMGTGFGYPGGCFSPYDPFCGFAPSHRLVTSPLPTRDMFNLGYKYGTLPAGEEQSGFLYFPLPPAPAATVQFEAELENAQHGDLQRFFIPFVIRAD